MLRLTSSPLRATAKTIISIFEITMLNVNLAETVAGNTTIPSMSTVYLHSFALIHAGCGPLIENTLRSRGYPNDYPNNTDCISSFPVPQGMVINITINELYLEDSISC